VKYPVPHDHPMSLAVIVQGPIGSGKTETCRELSDLVRGRGYRTGGVLCPRSFRDGEIVGYDAVEPASGERWPLARLRGLVEGPSWFSHGRLIYSFSREGMERVNRCLIASAANMGAGSFVFVDEFGRLERAKAGIYEGARNVAEGLLRGGVAVFLCRADCVESVSELVRGRAGRTLVFEPGDASAIWEGLKI
jgi:nucleoside-triphosphatase THEP1